MRVLFFLLICFSSAAQEQITLKAPLGQNVVNTVGDDLIVGPVLPSTGNIVQSSGYYTLNSGSVNIGTGTTFYCLSLAHRTRIRQAGSITRVAFYLPSKPAALTAFYFQVWRKNGSNYDRIGQENVLSSMVAASDNDITLATPIDVLEGDYVGYGYTVSSDPGNFLNGVTLASSGRYVNSTPTSSGYNWSAGTSLGQYWPINTYMKAPVIVSIGNSIAAGHTAHDSYIEQSVSPDAPTTTYIYKVGALLNVPTQNMGIGSQGTGTISARFAADVVALKPRYAIIEGGVNDVAAGTANGTIITNFTSMLNAAVAADIIPVVMLVLPWTDGTDPQSQQIDALNILLTALVATYPTAILVDARAGVGQEKVGGDPGNLWDIQTSYDADGIHFNAAGNTVIAQYIANAILEVEGYKLQVYGNQYVYGNLTVNGSSTFTGTSTFNIPASSTDHDKFVVDSANVLKYRTGAQMLSDLGVTPGWGLTGNNIDDATEWLGTTGSDKLIFKTNNTERGFFSASQNKLVVGSTDNGTAANFQGVIIPHTDNSSSIGTSSLRYTTFFGSGVNAATNIDMTVNSVVKVRIRSTGTSIGTAANADAILKLGAGTVSANGAALKFTSGAASQTTKEAGAVNYDGTNLTLSDATYAYTLAKFLTATATLDFASTGSGAVADLTVTVTGAAVGDVVTIGVPNGSITSTGSWFAWVSATDTVTVRFSPKATEDPASGSYKVNVLKQ